MESKTDLELLGSFAAGDDAAFEELFRRYRQKAFNVAYRALGSREAAEDVVIETFVRLYGGDLRIRQDFSSYFYRMVVNNSLSYMRRQRSHAPLTDDISPDRQHSSDPMHMALKNEAEEEARRALDALPDSQKMAFILIKYEGLSYREASSIMKVSEKAVDSLMSRARAGLKKYFDKKEDKP
ncbi:MAG: RNA polymerase sigma factor [Abditibacteriota bacterium]|nr:RNA polymerase sigma factor [Abditibacteriota bacterium]